MADKATKSESDVTPETKLEKKVKVKDKKIRRLYIAIAALSVLLVGGAALGYWQYSDLRAENKKLSNPEEAAKLETDRLKRDVSKLVDVPTDEEPTIATVTDITKLKDQPFFAKAQNGDKVLMYAKAKKAILFRPSTSKVVELAPINSTENTPDKQAGVQQSTPKSDSSATQTPAASAASDAVTPAQGQGTETGLDQ